MEVLGGVASVVAVVTLALQSTKVIYEVASSISHGSDDIDRLAKAASNLEKLLRIIKRLAEHAKNTNSVAEGKLLEALTPIVDECANALREVSPKIMQLQKDSNDRPWKKAKKYAKGYLDTKGVTEIWNIVSHYVELLGSCLGNASVDVGLFNAQELHLLHGEFSAASRDNKYRFSQIEEVLRNQSALAQAGFDAFQAKYQQDSFDARAAATTQIQGIVGLKADQQHFGEAAAVGYEKIADLHTEIQHTRATIDNEAGQAGRRSEALMTEVQRGISKVTNSASAQVEEGRHMNAEVMQKLHSISNRLEAVPGVASEQLSTLQSLVEMMSGMQLGMHTGIQSSPKATTDETYSNENHGNNVSQPTYYADFEGIVARICRFAGTMTTCRYSKDAQTIIEDIGRLLGLMMQQLSATSSSRDDLPRKRKVLSDYQYSKLETEVQSMEDLAKAKRILTASERVLISDQDSKEIHSGDESEALVPGHFQDSLSKSVRRRMASNANLQNIVRSWTLQNGRIDAIFKTTLLPDDEDQSVERADERFAAKLLVTPKSASHSNLRVIVNIASSAYRNGTLCLTPSLTFRAIIPSDSEVFRVVKGGSVRKLKKLLSSGAASLGDCDPIGRSLLNFALFNCRREMTRFLIQSGADVDALEPPLDPALGPRFGGRHFLVKPWHMLRSTLDVETADEDLERRGECYKILLDTGSDLSSISLLDYDGTDFYPQSAFSKELNSGTVAKVKALLDLGEPFINLDSTGDNNPVETIPLLLLANGHPRYWAFFLEIPDKIALLLSRGANTKARNSGGATCLHLVLRHHHNERGCWCKTSGGTLRYLYNTKDVLILMISAGADVCAIDGHGRSVSDIAIHSQLQKVWIEALKYCGIDIRDVLARPNTNPAHSTAMSSEYRGPPRALASKIMLTQYLKRRKPVPESMLQDWEVYSPDISSSEEDESESEDGPSEDEDSVTKAAKVTETVNNKSTEESEEPHGNHEDSWPRKKTKLE